MTKESPVERGQRILKQLKAKYPTASSYDLDGRNLHFVCEVEPVSEHPEYDKAVEVVIKSIPHKHLKMTQWYTIISGSLKLYLDDKPITLNAGDKYTIKPGIIHWAESLGDSECWLQIHSIPGWKKEDHIRIEQAN